MIRIGSANEVITIAKNIAEDIKRKYGRESTVLPNGVNIPQLSEGDETLKKIGAQKKKYILSVGRFVPEKGFDDLIEAFNKGSFDPWKLVLVGDADHEDKFSLNLKKKASENHNIILTGFLTGQPLKEMFSHAGLFILPSYYEGLPIVLLEALSYGLSCIVSDIPANTNIDLDEDRFFKVGDISELSMKISDFILKPRDEKDIKRQVNLIAEKYSWETIANKTLKVYHDVVS